MKKLIHSLSEQWEREATLDYSLLESSADHSVYSFSTDNIPPVFTFWQLKIPSEQQMDIFL